MHLIVPFAGVLSEAGRHTAQSLTLPSLEKLLARARPGATIGGDERSLSAPHELALAQALGWPPIDGRLPLAARAAALDGVATGERPVGLLTPVHLHLGTEQVTMTDPDTLDLDEADARGLFDTLQPLFTDVGFELHWGSAQRWYLVHDSLADWPTASLDRVIGRNIDPWLTDAPVAHLWPRLQSETQMLLHSHPINARREEQGLASVNSVWLSGCGTGRAARAEEPRVDQRLRGPALGEDWAAWAEAWQALDAGPIASLLHAHDGAVLTLAGERRTQPFTLQPTSAWQRMRSLWQRAPAHRVLEAL
ncbi:MAG TPA: hypothetical protein VFO28_00180 [Burkholderiaceae bacterium]|nr:hypothetical protein [Burkholderiaceae bacterium]